MIIVAYFTDLTELQKQLLSMLSNAQFLKVLYVFLEQQQYRGREVFVS